MAVPFAVISLLFMFVASLLIIRTGTIALVMTGVSEEVASFQAASAFSGAGFTTKETEQTISTPHTPPYCSAFPSLSDWTAPADYARNARHVCEHRLPAPY